MQVIKHAPGVYEIPNFLSHDELESLDDLLYHCTAADWLKTVINTHGEDDYWFGKILFCDVPQSITTKVAHLFTSYSRLNPLRGIQRLQVGQEMPPHFDSVSDSDIQYGIVMYLNDDFTGGETIYPNLNLAIKPKRGHLIVHNANHLHGAALVSGGDTRYILSCFARGTKETPAVLSDFFSSAP
jgi:hypothetical protein